MCASLISNSSFSNLFQITKLQKDCIASAAVAIDKLFNNPDVETVKLIHEVRQSYESKCTSYSRFVLSFSSDTHFKSLGHWCHWKAHEFLK